MVRGYDGTNEIGFSIVIGTGVGLLIIGMLGKRYIFRLHARNAANDGQIVILPVYSHGMFDNRFCGELSLGSIISSRLRAPIKMTMASRADEDSTGVRLGGVGGPKQCGKRHLDRRSKEMRYAVGLLDSHSDT